MKAPPLLDTHIWLWWLLGDSRLDEAEARYLDELPADRRPLLCDISLWEVALLVDRGRLELDCPLAQFLKTAASPATVRLLPITAETVLQMNNLPESFHRDPADRIIVSSALSLNLPLASRDALIVDSQLVKIWSL